MSGDSSPGFADLSWAQRLHRTVQSTTGDPVDHLNTGVIGARVADVSQTQLAPVTDYGPDLVGVVAGGNDLFVPEVDRTGLEAGLERLFDAVAALQARARSLPRGHAALATAIVETFAPTLPRPAGDTDLRLTPSAPQPSPQPRLG